MFRWQAKERDAELSGPRQTMSRRRKLSASNSTWRKLATGIPVSRDLPPIQTQLEVGASGDEFEKAADSVADQVMRMPESGRGDVALVDEEVGATVQRQPLEANEEDEMGEGAPAVQTKPLSDGDEKKDSGAAADIKRLQTGGEPLSASERSWFEPRFGHDFQDVRIHTNAVGADAAQKLRAKAFTFGNHIAFAGGRYQPASAEGRRLLAHELTHVVQQRAGKRKSLQRSPEAGSGGGLSEPDIGSITFRLREGGGIEIVGGLPRVPGAGNLGIGARRLPNGRWQPVFGRDPSTSTESYSWPEMLDLVRGHVGATTTTPEAVPPSATLPGTSELSPTLPGLPGASTTPGPAPPSASTGLAPPSVSLTEPSLDVRRARTLVLDGFRVDQHTLSDAQKNTLDGTALRLRMDDVPVILVHGHTDTTGTEVHNVGLALRRAEAVRDALVARGVDGPRLVVEGHGESEPAVFPERTAADRARNRRVELFWLRPAASSPRFSLGSGQ